MRYATMSKSALLREIQTCETAERLAEIWADLSAYGYAEGGLMWRAMERRRAKLSGEELPEFPEPPGKNLPPILGRGNIGGRSRPKQRR